MNVIKNLTIRDIHNDIDKHGNLTRDPEGFVNPPINNTLYFSNVKFENCFFDDVDFAFMSFDNCIFENCIMRNCICLEEGNPVDEYKATINPSMRAWKNAFYNCSILTNSNDIRPPLFIELTNTVKTGDTIHIHVAQFLPHGLYLSVRDISGHNITGEVFGLGEKEILSFVLNYYILTQNNYDFIKYLEKEKLPVHVINLFEMSKEKWNNWYALYKGVFNHITATKANPYIKMG